MNINIGDKVNIEIIDQLVLQYLKKQVTSVFNIPVVFATPQLWQKYQKQGIKNTQIPVMMIRRGPVDRQYFHSRIQAYFKKNKYDKNNPYGAIVDVNDNQSPAQQQEENITYVTDRPMYISVNYVMTILCKKLTDLNKLIEFFANMDQVYWNKTFISIEKNQDFIPIAQQFQKHFRLDIPFMCRKYLVNPVRQYPPIKKIKFPIKQLPSQKKIAKKSIGNEE